MVLFRQLSPLVEGVECLASCTHFRGSGIGWRMREISPRVNVSVEDYLKRLSPQDIVMVEEIRRQKQAGLRPRPSTTLVDRSSLLTNEHRRSLLDAAAVLVDENYCGRSEMCFQFADLLHRALTHLNFPSRAAVGWAIYFSPEGQEIYRWRHAWVRVGDEVIDGNVDCLSENRLIPKTVRIAPYWGPIIQIPEDRRLRQEHGLGLPPDTDVSDIWWPELKDHLDKEFK